MDRDPGDFRQHSATEDVAAMSDADFTAWLERLPPPPALPQTPEEIAAADAEAMADLAAGRTIPHAVVAEWMQTWGKPGRLPFKEWFATRDG